MAEVDFNSMTPAEQQELLDGPSLAPPTNTISNFNNAPNSNGVSYATIGLCLSLSTVFLFLRAYATFTYLKRQYLSDCKYFLSTFITFLILTLFRCDGCGLRELFLDN